MPYKSTSLGDLEVLVLLAVLRRDGEASGIPVRDEIRRQARRSLTLGTVYKTLMRLEDKGLLAASLSEPEARRGGRRRKLYRVTADGRRALQRTLAALDRMTDGLPVALGTR